MSAIALILNLLLGGLLVAALALGLRLDRRLRALRESQAGFIKAVADLDQAAARTHAGLAQWRDAADEARELLHDRTEKAKLQVIRLETLLAEAARAPGAARPPRPAEPMAEPDAPLVLGRDSARPPEPQAPPAARSRARVDDDLFDAAPPAQDAAALQRGLAAALRRRS